MSTLAKFIDTLDEEHRHLDAAQRQRLPSDDRINAEHVDAAAALITACRQIARAESRARPALTEHDDG